jgi:hypothetical protein
LGLIEGIGSDNFPVEYVVIVSGGMVERISGGNDIADSIVSGGAGMI